jgi:hypothetical protein
MPSGTAMKYTRVRITFPQGSAKTSTLLLVLRPKSRSYTNTGAFVRVDYSRKSSMLNYVTDNTLVVGETTTINYACENSSTTQNNSSNGLATLSTKKMVAYPNPTTSSVSLDFEYNKASTVMVKLFDIAGPLQKEIQTNTVARNNTVILSLAELPVGNYTVHVLQNNNFTHFENITKE